MNIVGRLRRGSLEAFFLNGMGMALLFVMHVVLGRLLGPQDYGIFSFVLALTNVLVVIAGLGWPNAVTRFFAQYIEQHEWHLLNGIFRRSFQITAGWSILLSLIAWLFSFLPGLSERIVVGVRFTAFLLPLYTFIKLRTGAFRGLQRVWISIVLELIIFPLLVVVGALVLSATSITIALWNYIGSGVLVFIIGTVWLSASMPSQSKESQPEFQTKFWLRVSIPMMLGVIGAVVMDQIDVLLVGTLIGANATGLFGAAERLARLNAFVLNAVTVIATPMLSAAYHGKRLKDFDAILRASTLWATLGALPLFVAMVIWPGQLLSFFGADYVDAAPLLRTLAVGQFVNAAAGPVGFTLLMTGHERTYAQVAGLVLFLDICGQFLAISLWGVLGAAIMTTIGLSLLNILLLWQVRLRIYRPVLQE
jgi:O-antigen/teichoic acid export membrane protein